ncbi:MAG: DUF4160 domain-containing protein [Alphaproteobacteria bacterium]|nr:DUF4160 domain-containing protein [Alphaproteobacteria bacterium]
MPTIAIIDGIKIEMFFNDHVPPHFHATLADHEALISIRTLAVLRGSLPPAAERKVQEWAATHQETLALNWLKCQEREAPERI